MQPGQSPLEMTANTFVSGDQNKQMYELLIFGIGRKFP